MAIWVKVMGLEEVEVDEDKEEEIRGIVVCVLEWPNSGRGWINGTELERGGVEVEPGHNEEEGREYFEGGQMLATGTGWRIGEVIREG